MAFCTECGVKNFEESKFCSGCGNNLGKGSTTLQKVEASVDASASKNSGVEKKKVSANPFTLPGQFIDAVNEETNVNELFKAYFMLILFHAFFWYLMGSDSTKYAADQTETIIYTIYSLLIIALSYFCVKTQGIKKSKVGWIYFLMVLDVVLYITTFIEPPEIDKFTKFDIYINYLAPLIELFLLGKMASLVNFTSKEND